MAPHRRRAYARGDGRRLAFLRDTAQEEVSGMYIGGGLLLLIVVIILLIWIF